MSESDGLEMIADWYKQHGYHFFRVSINMMQEARAGSDQAAGLNQGEVIQRGSGAVAKIRQRAQPRLRQQRTSGAKKSAPRNRWHIAPSSGGGRFTVPGDHGVGPPDRSGTELGGPVHINITNPRGLFGLARPGQCGSHAPDPRHIHQRENGQPMIAHTHRGSRSRT